MESMTGKRNRKKNIKKRKPITLNQAARKEFKHRTDPLDLMAKKIEDSLRYNVELARRNTDRLTISGIAILRKQLLAQQHTIRLITRLIVESIDAEYNVEEEVENAEKDEAKTANSSD